MRVTTNSRPTAYLHSSMDRFEVTEVQLELIKQNDLHSSMDRFEVKSATFKTNLQVIYIPVWIDLKNNFIIFFS